MKKLFVLLFMIFYVGYISIFILRVYLFDYIIDNNNLFLGLCGLILICTELIINEIKKLKN